MNRLWNILIACLLLGAVASELQCLAAHDSDHCADTEQCFMCASSVTAEPAAPVFIFVRAASTMVRVDFSEPSTPHVAPLTPPPRSDI